jgi:hypothetical protein
MPMPSPPRDGPTAMVGRCRGTIGGVWLPRPWRIHAWGRAIRSERVGLPIQWRFWRRKIGEPCPERAQAAVELGSPVWTRVDWLDYLTPRELQKTWT